MKQTIRVALVVMLGALLACGSPDATVPTGAGGRGTHGPETPVSSTPHPGSRSSRHRKYRLVVPNAGMVGVHPLRWQSFKKVGVRSLLVRFVSGVEPCNVLGRVEVGYGHEQVTITLYEGHDPKAGAVACIEIAELKQVRVELDGSLRGRVVVDGSR